MIGRIGVVALSAVLFAAAPTIAEANSEIGSVAAVNRDIEGTPPGQGSRALILGDRLIANERLVSSPLGSGQMLFLDQTSLTVSPNSEIVLDKYVYDPDADAGELGLTVTRGVLRVIGGRISKKTDAVIRTPSATIGVRGGIALVAVDSNSQTRVMHIAGEYTKVQSGGQTLTMSRANALATVSGDAPPDYQGVADEDQIGSLYDQMQGGGGGTEEEVSEETTTDQTVTDVNSEEPDAVTDQPISTSGESGEDDKSVEIETANLFSDPELQLKQRVNAVDNPFAAFIGGVIVVDDQPLVDSQGELIANPALQNFVSGGDGRSARFARGSLIAILDNGETVRLPEPDDGFFVVKPADTASTIGRLSGGGFGDPDAGLFIYYLENQAGQRGAVFGAVEGPKQLREINAGTPDFRATAFNVLPDLHIAEALTTQAFLPEGLGEAFNNGKQTQVFLINRPNATTFTPGSGFGTSTGSRWLIPQFHLSGEGANQRFLLHVGATSVQNNGGGSPDMTSFGRGAFRVGAQGFANRLQAFVGTTSIQSGNQTCCGATVFGANDQYLLLGNSSAYQTGQNPDIETAASFFQNVGDGSFVTYGNLQLAQRAGTQTFDPAARVRGGLTPGAYANRTGRGGVPAATRTFDHGFAANAAGFRDGQGATDKLLMRSRGAPAGATLQLGLNSARGSMILTMDETTDSADISGHRLAFGGQRSAVIDDRRFGFRDHQNPGGLENNIAGAGQNATSILTTENGEKTGLAPGQFGQRAFRGALLSHGLADANAIFPANTDTTPRFLKWGWWTGQFRFANDASPTFDNARLQYSLGTWVTGVKTLNLPVTGQATFNGPVVLNVLTANGNDFVDGGRFRLNWDFGAAAGNARFQQVLGFNSFTVPVSANNAVGNNHYGGFTTIGQSGVAQVDGAFFDGLSPGDARATAGSIRIQDPTNNRFATGTFWGER